MSRSIGVIDGRYREATEDLRAGNCFTERALVIEKGLVELSWLIYILENVDEVKQVAARGAAAGPPSPPASPTATDMLSTAGMIGTFGPLSGVSSGRTGEQPLLEDLVGKLKKIHASLETNEDFKTCFVNRVREVEKITKHDTKAVELSLNEVFDEVDVLRDNVKSFTHIGLTSEDITNTAYAVMFNRASNVLHSVKQQVIKSLYQLAADNVKTPLLSLTHGQPATPTTFGKELCVFLYRLHQVGGGAAARPAWISPKIKFTGATGTVGALSVAFDKTDWIDHIDRFISGLHQSFNSPPAQTPSEPSFSMDMCTTQISTREWMIHQLHLIQMENNVLTDLSKDLWLYISRQLLDQVVADEREVGSSVMPHKVNPINFENAEGNFAVANSLISLLCQTLSQSRLQRDLSDSTVIRNLGVVFSHVLIALKSLQKGLAKVKVNGKQMIKEIQKHPEIIAEPIQTILRKYPHNFDDPYTTLKLLTRHLHSFEGPKPETVAIQDFVRTIEGKIQDEDYAKILRLLSAPESYVGLAPQIADKVLKLWEPLLS